MNEKVIELLKKLKELAERGVDGERETAEVMLKKLMRKHGVTEDDLDSPKLRKRFFYYVQNQQSFLFQVISTVLGEQMVQRATRKNGHRWRWMVTDAEYIEIEARWDFFSRLYKQEERIFYKAFIAKHRLYDKDATPTEWDDLTMEQKQEHLRVKLMAEGLQDKSFVKQLNNG